MKASIGGGGDFAIAPEGLIGSRIREIIDIGTTDGTFGKKHQIIVIFELVDECDEQGRPFDVMKYYTLSLHEKANLCKDIESIAGKKMTDEDKLKFEFPRLLGVACMVNLQHRDTGTRVRADIKGITPVPKGMTVSQLKGKPVFFDLDDPNSRIQYQQLPEWQQKIVAQCEEFSGTHVAPAQQAPAGGHIVTSDQAPVMDTNFDDDIPF